MPVASFSSSRALPLAAARAALTLMPPFLLARALAGLSRHMAARHPRLFRNLAQLPPFLIAIDPLDVPHRFVLHLGVPMPFICLDDDGRGTVDAVVRASLDSLLAMLEGRVDGDTLFFSRDMSMEGRTDAIVSLRNTLDREEIVLTEDLLTMTGPFESAARAVAGTAAGVLQKLHGHAAAFHAALHAEGEKT